MHRPGRDGDVSSGDPSPEGKESWAQFGQKMRFVRKRVKVVDIAGQLSYEYRFLKKMCMRRPPLRQWAVRDDMCRVDPGLVEMSPSMQAAFMRVYRSKSKGEIRAALRDMIPLLDFRHTHQKQLLHSNDPESMIPEGEPDTLNQKKREMYTRNDADSGFRRARLVDEQAHTQIRWNIRLKLLRFQRKMAVANAAASRAVMYSEADAVAYLLFRGPAMYAAVHRVLFEVSRMLPFFVPKTMLDFGSGTGTAILAAKEVYDPGSLAHPVYRNHRKAGATNDAKALWVMEELKYDLGRLQRSNAERKKARFLAVASMIDSGELALADMPEDLRREIVSAAQAADNAARRREAQEAFARRRDIVSGREWTGSADEADADASAEGGAGGGSAAGAPSRAPTLNESEGAPAHFPGESADLGAVDDAASMDDDSGEGAGAGHRTKTWWERYVDDEAAKREDGVQRRLRPLQSIVAVEPSPGMMETAVMVLNADVPTVQWKRFLLPEDEGEQHDLVISAYSLTEISTAAQRRETVRRLWKMTRGVLIIMEYASIPGYNIVMEARDTILEDKGVGLWDWQPTIIGPCPHEQRCPVRHAKHGVKDRAHRVCSTEVTSRSTFVERWARRSRLVETHEPVSYIIFARNEAVPDRVHRRKVELAAQEAAAKAERDAKQRALYEASLSVGDVVFERLSEEALHRPQTDAVPPVPREGGAADDGSDGRVTGGAVAAAPGATLSPAALASLTIVGAPLPAPETLRWEAEAGDRRHKHATPQVLPIPTHKYNRMPFVDVAFQSQRVLTPSEVLVVRSDITDLRRHYTAQIPRYLRVVSTPHCRGRVTASFCTPEGDLITGRVYRRYYGPQGPLAPPKNLQWMWQYVGGWALLRSTKRGGLFPADVSLYSVQRVPQVDYATTNTDLKAMSIVESTAMQYGNPIDPSKIPAADADGAGAIAEEDAASSDAQAADEASDDERSPEARRAARRRRLEAIERAEIGDTLERTTGQRNGLTLTQQLDARAAITSEEWTQVVRAAKHRAANFTSHNAPAKGSVPFANRVRKMQALRDHGVQPKPKIYKAKLTKRLPFAGDKR